MRTLPDLKSRSSSPVWPCLVGRSSRVVVRRSAVDTRDVRGMSCLTVGSLAALVLVGCGSRTAESRSEGPTSRGGCTDTWTGKAGDAEYETAANWSAGRVPTKGDFACIRPGSLVKVSSAPIEPATSLLIEGTLCMLGDPSELALSIYNGAPPGQRPLPPLPGSTSLAPPCPPGTGLSFQGSSQSGSNASPSRPGPAGQPAQPAPQTPSTSQPAPSEPSPSHPSPPLPSDNGPVA
jgi:hypothetical protein